jgi:protein-L-isoaspartate O-methyltransferase
MMITATYSPEDNKLRLYPGSRLDPETYARVKAHGFRWAPKQELFVAPAWSPGRADLATELAGEIGDEDTSLVERAQERAERFENYSEHRAADADSAHKAVASIADNIPLGQPILIGHHSERHARKDAQRIESGMRRAVKMWETSQYWTARAAGAVRCAKYKERPDVRTRRIKGLEADLRKVQKNRREASGWLKAWASVLDDAKLKHRDGTPSTAHERAVFLANHCHLHVAPSPTGYWSAWDVLRPDGDRYAACPSMTVEQVQAIAAEHYPQEIARFERWVGHFENRLAYERAMQDEAGGTAADKMAPERGGACRCWASPRGGWSYIQKVNKVTVSVLDSWGNAGRVFGRTIPFDKLAGIMSAAQVAAARLDGRLVEASSDQPGNPSIGFYLTDAPPPVARPQPAKDEQAPAFEAMREQLREGVKVVVAPQLFPTPRDLAARAVALADIQPGQRVLEPSAGTGALLGAMGGQMFAHNPDAGEVVAVEINARLSDRLRAEYPLTDVRCADFLSCNGDLGAFDRILMNPPFKDGADILHVRHALGFLKPGGRLVAIVAGGPRQEAALQPIADSWEPLPAGTFEGTGARSVLLSILKAPSLELENPTPQSLREREQLAKAARGGQLSLIGEAGRVIGEG